MDSGMIGKIDKAKRYAQERKRFRFTKFDVVFHGDNNDHHITFDNGVFKCDCDFFKTRRNCSHTMALETLLQDTLPEVVAT